MLHNASHYAFVGADGYAIDFEYKGSGTWWRDIEVIDEVRPCHQMGYYYERRRSRRRARREMGQ